MEVEGLNTLLLLLPALGWGLLPPVVAKLGGKPSNEILGTALGTLIASVGVFIVLRPQITLQSFLLAAFAGAFWIVGQVGQYHGYQKNRRFPNNADFYWVTVSGDVTDWGLHFWRMVDGR